MNWSWWRNSNYKSQKVIAVNVVSYIIKSSHDGRGIGRIKLKKYHTVLTVPNIVTPSTNIHEHLLFWSGTDTWVKKEAAETRHFDSTLTHSQISILTYQRSLLEQQMFYV